MISKPMSPEQTKAYEHLSKHVSYWELHTQDVRIETGFVTFSSRPLHLPTESNWVWNQSLRKVQGLCEGGTYVIHKTTARKRRGFDGKAPSYKVWLFTLQLDHLMYPLYAMWCERGREPLVTVSSPVKLEEDPLSAIKTECTEEWDVSLSSLSFLAPFTTEELAKEFGWL